MAPKSFCEQSKRDTFEIMYHLPGSIQSRNSGARKECDYNQNVAALVRENPFLIQEIVVEKEQAHVPDSL